MVGESGRSNRFVPIDQRRLSEGAGRQPKHTVQRDPAAFACGSIDESARLVGAIRRDWLWRICRCQHRRSVRTAETIRCVRVYQLCHQEWANVELVVGQWFVQWQYGCVSCWRCVDFEWECFNGITPTQWRQSRLWTAQSGHVLAGTINQRAWHQLAGSLGRQRPFAYFVYGSGRCVSRHRQFDTTTAASGSAQAEATTRPAARAAATQTEEHRFPNADHYHHQHEATLCGRKDGSIAGNDAKQRSGPHQSTD